MMLAALAVAAAMLNPAVTPQTQGSTICRPGFTKAVRPPQGYIRAWKRTHGARKGDVADHIVPLELGGRAYAPNLQLQSKADAKRKDRLENALHRAVCAGRVRLEDAQARMEAWRP
jgi:hypothetical protein